MRPALILAVFSVLLVGAGPALTQQKVIKIGALYPLTGNLTATGMECKRSIWRWRLSTASTT